MAVEASPERDVTAPIPYPLDQDPDGVNRPGLYLNPIYHRLRETGTGVGPVRCRDGTLAKLVPRYHDVKQVLRDSKAFSREKAADADEVPLQNTLLGLDPGTGPNDHTQVRKAARDWFTPRAIERLKATTEERAEAQLKAMVERGEPADLVTDFAFPFALNMVCDMLGLPQEGRTQFREWGDAFLGTSRQTSMSSDEAAIYMAAYMDELVKKRREKPGDDLLSHIAAAGAHLSEETRTMLPITIVIGGWETVVSSIGLQVLALHEHPYGGYDTAYAYLADHPEEVPGAVTELERMFSVTAADAMPRRVMQDVTLPSGERLHEGDLVFPSINAANYDPRVFPDPERMDFSRDFERNQHLSFGYGAHHCIGRHLGHLEVVTAIAALTRELPTLRPAVPPEEITYKPDHKVLGPTALPVTW